MNEVEAVKTQEKVNEITQLLIKHGSLDYAHIWVMGINVALRITDLLSLKFDDFDMERKELVILEGKTAKTRKNPKPRVIDLTETVIKIIEERKQDNPDFLYLFQATGNRNANKIKPMDRTTISKKFKEVGDIVGVKLGTHSLRKTFGFSLYDHGHGCSIQQIREILGHSSESITRRYIGLDAESRKDAYIKNDNNGGLF